MQTSPNSRWLLALLPVAVALVAYADSLPGDFVYDDVVLVKRGIGLRDFDLHRIFLENYWSTERADRNYRPLTLLTYAINYRLGEGPCGFHVVNWILNAGVAFLAWLLLRRILASDVLAALGASLYAVLPVHTEAVSNIVGRAELLASLAILGAWILALKGLEGGRYGKERWLSAALAGAFTLLGLLSKENSVVVPLVLVVWGVTVRKKVPWKAAACSTLAVVAYLAVREIVLRGKINVVTFADNPLYFTDPFTRFLNALRLLGLSLAKIVFPVRLSADYSFNQIPVRGLGDPTLWITAFAVLAFLALVVWLSWRRAPIVALAVLFFLVASAPTSNLFFPVGTIFAERLAFTPSLGYPLFLCAVFLAPGLRGRLGPAWAVFGILVVVYGGQTWVRNQDWSSARSMYARMSIDAPFSSRSHLKDAESYVLEWQATPPGPSRNVLLEKAKEAVARSLEIYPESGNAMASLGEIMLYEGEYAEAVEQLARGGVFLTKQHSFQPSVFLLRGQCYLRLGKYTEAEADLRRYIENLAQRSAPPDARAFNFLGLALALQGRLDAALPEFSKATSLRRDLPDLWNNLAMCRLSLKDPAGAIEDWKRALEVAHHRMLDETEVTPARILSKMAGASTELARLRRAAADEEGARRADADAARYSAEAGRAAEKEKPTAPER